MTTTQSPVTHLNSIDVSRLSHLSSRGSAYSIPMNTVSHSAAAVTSCDAEHDISHDAMPLSRHAKRSRISTSANRSTSVDPFVPSWRSQGSVKATVSNTEGAGRVFIPRQSFHGRGVRAGGADREIFEHARGGRFRAALHRIGRIAQSPGGLLILLVVIGTVFGLAVQSLDSSAVQGAAEAIASGVR